MITYDELMEKRKEQYNDLIEVILDKISNQIEINWTKNTPEIFVGLEEKDILNVVKNIPLVSKQVRGEIVNDIPDFSFSKIMDQIRKRMFDAGWVCRLISDEIFQKYEVSGVYFIAKLHISISGIDKNVS